MNMTFETFIATPGSERACRLARNVAQGAGRRARLVVLQGGTGSGKTHLLMAAARAVVQRDQIARVVSTTAERLARELIAALQAGREHEWREQCRDVRLLTVDDLQTLVGKPATQQALAAAFSTWLAWGVSIACATGAARSQLANLMRGLRLRRVVRWVTIGPLAPPDRHQLVEAVFAMRGLRPGSDVVRPIVHRCGGDVRRIVGAAVQLHAASRLASAATAPPWLVRPVSTARNLHID